MSAGGKAYSAPHAEQRERPDRASRLAGNSQRSFVVVKTLNKSENSKEH